MKTLEITRLELVGFGKFRERTIDLTSGLNLIEGPNEAGKSTIQSFITGMFYGFFQPGTKRRSYTPHRDKYRPWDQGSYRGVLVCKNEERSWRIERCFDKDNETVNVYDDQTGDDLTLDFPYNPVTRQPQVGEKLLGLSKTAFNNTANIAQMTCASVSREADFSAEVNDKLLSVMKTADASLSLSAVIHELDSRIEQIGSPKKSKTPYGQACQLKKELEEELEESGKNQKDYQQLCTQIDRLAEQTAQLQKEKELLETQIRQSAAKELGGRYLKAQNLRTRIERIEKEYEKYAIYQSVDLQEIDQTQKRMAAKAQINRTMEKYRRASQEVEHRIQELNTLYRTLEVSEASEEVLEQFESVYERYLTLGQMGQEIKEMMIRQRNIAFHRSRLNPMDLNTKGDIMKKKKKWIKLVIILLVIAIAAGAIFVWKSHKAKAAAAAATAEAGKGKCLPQGADACHRAAGSGRFADLGRWAVCHLKGGAAGSRNRLCNRRCPAGAVGRRFLDAAAQKYSGTRTGKNRVDAAGYSARLPAFR